MATDIIEGLVDALTDAIESSPESLDDLDEGVLERLSDLLRIYLMDKDVQDLDFDI